MITACGFSTHKAIKHDNVQAFIEPNTPSSTAHLAFPLKVLSEYLRGSVRDFSQLLRQLLLASVPVLVLTRAVDVTAVVVIAAVFVSM